MHVFVAAIFAGLVASGLPALAQSGVQTQRLMATGLAIDADPKINPTAAIWQDKLPAISAVRRSAAAAAPSVPISHDVTVFNAAFRDRDRTIILSVIRSPLAGDCENYSGAGFPSGNTCPMRIAVVQNGRVKIIRSEERFWFDIAQKENGEFDNKTEGTQTTVAFNLATHELTVTGIADGKPDQAPGPPIVVTY